MAEKRKIELLAPAKNLEVGKIAIDAGADAVYIGAPQFGARQSAGNSLEDIKALCNYAHIFGCKVLVTLNTILTDEELPIAVEMAWKLYHIGVDALIIQDMGLLECNLPPIRLHASTQCNNTTPEKVKWLEQVGFKRVVLARELSLNEIKTIREQTSVELEAFVHGALCVSYSGQCYLSQAVCGRSANRGCCAQMCRQKYDLLDADMNEIAHQRYFLSLKDMDRSQSISDLIDAGVTTFKIEGRLKDADYVKNIVTYYRHIIDQIIDNTISHTIDNTTAAPFANPEKTFHRGQTDYFLYGRNQHLANFDTPKSTGEYIGKVVRIADRYLEIENNELLHNGDGLCFADQGFMVNRVEGNKVFPREMPNVKIGTKIYRNYDIEFQKLLAKSLPRKRKVDILFSETDNGFCLQIDAVSKSFPQEKQLANNPEKATETIRLALSKLGDTPFEANKIEINLSQSYFLPMSVLNQMRREVAQMLIEKLQTNPLDCVTAIAHPAVNFGGYLNIHNTKAAQFYTKCGVTNLEPSFEQKPTADYALMTCRYCLLHELGQCRKINPQQNEPHYLRTSNLLFRLTFDCRNCQMIIAACETMKMQK